MDSHIPSDHQIPKASGAVTDLNSNPSHDPYLREALVISSEHLLGRRVYLLNSMEETNSVFYLFASGDR